MNRYYDFLDRPDIERGMSRRINLRKEQDANQNE
jgi:hypothetical protein